MTSDSTGTNYTEAPGARYDPPGLTSEQIGIYERLEVLVDQALAQYEQGLAVNVEAEMMAIARDLTTRQST